MFSDELYAGLGAVNRRESLAVLMEMSAVTEDLTPRVGPETFWQSVIAFERAPHTTHFQQLIELGLSLDDPAQLDDVSLSKQLWDVIHALAKMRVFLKHTNHLSDRELYEVLWWDLLREETVDTALLPDMHCHLDILGIRDREHRYQYLKYFADEQERRFWSEQYPDLDLPLHQDPPYHRDAILPA